MEFHSSHVMRKVIHVPNFLDEQYCGGPMKREKQFLQVLHFKDAQAQAAERRKMHGFFKEEDGCHVVQENMVKLSAMSN